MYWIGMYGMELWEYKCYAVSFTATIWACKLHKTMMLKSIDQFLVSRGSSTVPPVLNPLSNTYRYMIEGYFCLWMATTMLCRVHAVSMLTPNWKSNGDPGLCLKVWEHTSLVGFLLNKKEAVRCICNDNRAGARKMYVYTMSNQIFKRILFSKVWIYAEKFGELERICCAVLNQYCLFKIWMERLSVGELQEPTDYLKAWLLNTFRWKVAMLCYFRRKYTLYQIFELGQEMLVANHHGINGCPSRVILCPCGTVCRKISMRVYNCYNGSSMRSFFSSCSSLYRQRRHESSIHVRHEREVKNPRINQLRFWGTRQSGLLLTQSQPMKHASSD